MVVIKKSKPKTKIRLASLSFKSPIMARLKEQFLCHRQKM